MLNRLFPERTQSHPETPAQQITRLTKERDRARSEYDTVLGLLQERNYHLNVAQERITLLTSDLAQCQNHRAKDQA